MRARRGVKGVIKCLLWRILLVRRSGSTPGPVVTLFINT